MALFTMGSGIPETDSPEEPLGGENPAVSKKDNLEICGRTRKVNGGSIVSYAKESVAPVFEEVDLNSCGSSNDDSVAISDDQTVDQHEILPPTKNNVVICHDSHLPHPLSSSNSKDTLNPNDDLVAVSDDEPDEHLYPETIDVVVDHQSLYPHPLSIENTKATFDRSVSQASSRSGKITPKQKISWGEVNDIPDKVEVKTIPDPIPNEREENHISRNQCSIPSAKSIQAKSEAQLYVWEVWPVAGSLVRINNKVDFV